MEKELYHTIDDISLSARSQLSRDAASMSFRYLQSAAIRHPLIMRRFLPVLMRLLPRRNDVTSEDDVQPSIDWTHVGHISTVMRNLVDHLSQVWEASEGTDCAFGSMSADSENCGACFLLSPQEECRKYGEKIVATMALVPCPAEGVAGAGASAAGQMCSLLLRLCQKCQGAPVACALPIARLK